MHSSAGCAVAYAYTSYVVGNTQPRWLCYTTITQTINPGDEVQMAAP